MTKGFIFLLIKKHSGEIDWILPIIHKIDPKIKLITFFDDFESYNSLQSNRKLFLLWKSRSYTYLILKNNKNFILRIIYKIIVFLKIFKYLEKKILTKIYNLDTYCKKIKINPSLIKACFLTFNNYSYFSQIIKNKNPKCLIIRYPESTVPLLSNFQLPKNERPYSRLYSDISLFSKKFEPLAIYKKNDLKNKQILVSGYPRYEEWWLKKFLKNRYKKNKKKFIIFVASRSLNEAKYNNTKAFQSNLNDYVHKSIMKIAMDLKNTQVIFKTHPNVKNKDYLQEILKTFPKRKWKIVNEHTITLSAESDVCIGVFTSASLDCLAIKKPTIEFIKFEKTIQQTIYDKKLKKNISIYKYLKLLNSIDSISDLRRFIFSHYNKTKYLKENKRIKRFFYSNLNSRKIANLIQKNLI